MRIAGRAGELELPVMMVMDDPATVAGVIARTGESARIDDYAAVPGPVGAHAVAIGITGAVGVPVRVSGTLWGCVVSMTRRASGLPADSELLLERFAGLLAVALANAASRRALRQEARLQQALLEVSAAGASGEPDAAALFGLVASRVAELLDAPSAVVVRTEDDTAVVVGCSGLPIVSETLALRDLAAASAARDADGPARVEDHTASAACAESGAMMQRTGYRAAVAVPVRLNGRPWGYIGAAKRQPYSFSPDAESMLERFAGLVTLALAQGDTLIALQRQATTDGLTGLLNHRAFQDRLDVEWARAARHARPLSLVMLDLDGFKLVNDLHGHDTGDLVLRTVGVVLERDRRAGDVCARVGGDEFAVIAPETTAVAALALAERLRGSAAAALEGIGVPVTLSAGVADLANAATTDDLFHQADRALYAAKRDGRDRALRYAPDGDDDPAASEHYRRLRALAGLTSLVRAVEAKDTATLQHSERVAVIAQQLAVRLGWSPDRCARLREVALLHDVGKIGVPDAIVCKRGRLSAAEYERVKAHSQVGAQIAEGVLDSEQTSWVRGHHERPDGRGYPDGLCADRIPHGARILSIADAYDTITTGRPYQAAMPPADAVDELRRHAGTQFDADLVEVLAQLVLHTN